MKIQKVYNKIINTLLEFNLYKNQWKKVIEINSFKNTIFTRQLSKIFENNELANEMVAYTNSY